MRGGRVCAVGWIYFFVPTSQGGTFAIGCWVGEGLPGLLGVVGVLGLLGLLGPVLRLLVLGVLVLGVVGLGDILPALAQISTNPATRFGFSGNLKNELKFAEVTGSLTQP